MSSSTTHDLPALPAVPLVGEASCSPPDHAILVRQLLELVAALDRRMPQVMRAGEVAIARDAASLRQQALRRIAELCAETD